MDLVVQILPAPETVSEAVEHCSHYVDVQIDGWPPVRALQWSGWLPEHLEAFRPVVREAEARGAWVQRAVSLSETGGAGSAIIVAGLDGGPLVSVGGRAERDGPHAVFHEPAALVVYYRREVSWQVNLARIDDRAPDRLGTEEVPLWRWDAGEGTSVLDAELTRDLAIPHDAIEAAAWKVRRQSCWTACYARGRYAGSGRHSAD